MATIIVDGQELQIGDDERLNCIQAADRAGVSIPFYCWHPGLSVVASCRMCLVEVGTRNKETGKVEMMPKLVPGCQTPAKDGTVIVTDSPKVRANQSYVQEGILLDHPVDCPICDQAGECRLQDYYFKYGRPERRADVLPFHSRRRDLGPHVSLFVDRCVMCTRCVRFTREVSGEAELMVINRGAHGEIDVMPGFPIENKLSGNVNDICPVGALCSTDFLYQQRVWFMEPHDSICTGCSTGCSTQLHENNNLIYRVQPRYNPNSNDWWMCDHGRYDNDYIRAPERITAIKKRVQDRFDELSWGAGLPEISEALRESVKNTGGKSLAVVCSPFLTVEEAYLLATFARILSPESRLVLGKIPVEGHDEVFKSGFTIRAERCPNRKGVEEILRHFDSQYLSWEEFLVLADKRELGAAYITGGYPASWNGDGDADRLDQISLRIVQDILPSSLARKAHYVIPGVTFAEKGGCYVNHAGLIQLTEWAVPPIEGAHVDGQTFSDFLGRRGIYQSAQILHELADKIPFFDRVKAGIPECGLNLVTGSEKRPLTSQLGTVTHPTPTFRAPGSAMLETDHTLKN